MILSGESSAKEADGRNPHESCSRRKVPCGLSGITVSTCYGERSPNDPAQPGPPACAVFACCGGRSGRVRASRTIPTMHPLPCRAREFYRGPCLWVSSAVKGELSAVEPALRAVEGCGTRNFLCALRCFSFQQAKTGLAGSSCARACGARK